MERLREAAYRLESQDVARNDVLLRYLEHAARFEAIAARRMRERNRLPEGRPAGPPTLPGARLSRRELAVLQLVAEGLTNQDISVRLQRSEETVKSCLRRILAKLGASCRAQAVAVGFRQHLLT